MDKLVTILAIIIFFIFIMPYMNKIKRETELLDGSITYYPIPIIACLSLHGFGFNEAGNWVYLCFIGFLLCQTVYENYIKIGEIESIVEDSEMNPFDKKVTEMMKEDKTLENEYVSEDIPY